MPTGVNLLPWRQRTAHRRRRRFSGQLITALLIGVAISAVAAQAVDHRVQIAGQRHQQLQWEADQLRDDLRIIRDLEQRRASYQQRLKVLESLAAKRTDTTATLTGLLAELPEETVLQRLTWDGSQLHLGGRSQDPAALALYLDQLESRPAFDQARLETLTPTRNGNPGQHFRIGVRLDSPANGGTIGE